MKKYLLVFLTLVALLGFQEIGNSQWAGIENYITFKQQANKPPSPGAIYNRLYFKTDGKLYYVSSAGTETEATSAATDTIWDDAGDLVQGIGADTAAKLTAGTLGSYLRSGGAGATNVWSTLTLPNAGTAYTLPVFSATDVMTELAAPGTTGQVLTGVTGAIPVWSSTLSISALDMTSSTSSIPWPVGTATWPTAEGSVKWHSTNDALYLGDGATSIILDFTANATYTFPTTTATLARTDAGQTFTGVQTMTSPVLTTPALGTPSAVVLTNATGFPSSPPGIVERIGAAFDGGGSAIPVNYTTYAHIPYAVTAINQWTIICKEDSGTTGIVITPYKDIYVEDDITLTTMCASGTLPHTSDGATAGGTSHQGTWDCNVTSLAANDVIQFKVTTAPTSATWCSISLKVTR